MHTHLNFKHSLSMWIPTFIVVVCLSLTYGATGCPYMFTPDLTNLCNHNVGSGSPVQVMMCCQEVYGAAVFAIAQYANKTGKMFLNETQAESCITMYRKELHLQKGLKTSFFDRVCPLPASRITQYATSCNFREVRELLKAQDLRNVSEACYQAGTKGCQGCQEQLLQATISLASHKNDQPGICGTAIAVALTSQNPDQLLFNNFYNCVLQILGGAPISQYLNMTTDDPPIDPIAVKPVPSFKEPSVSSNVLVILLGTLGGLVALACFLLVAVYVVRRCTTKYDLPKTVPASGALLSSDYSEATTLPTEGFYVFTLKELIKATNNFSDSLLVGEGSAGKVYLGHLPSKKLVAVKRIQKEKKVETFYKEVELLARIRHPNLTALLGYCQAKHDHLLVYEYMSNGDLAMKLLSKDGPVLTWDQRIKIALDCARGLTYLHECPEGPIVHRDIKPTNILLNDTLEAKLSDFGLSKIIEADASHVSTEIKGTTGYLDPEYLILGQLTEASDVYSFGIVLLQLISGKKAIDKNSQFNRNIVELANSVIDGQENLSELLDPKMQNRVSFPAFKKMAEVAYKCVQPRSYDRPCISEVLDNLEYVVKLGKAHPPSL